MSEGFEACRGRVKCVSRACRGRVEGVSRAGQMRVEGVSNEQIEVLVGRRAYQSKQVHHGRES